LPGGYTYRQIDPVRDLLDSVGFTGDDIFVVSMLHEFGNEPTRVPLRAIVVEARRP
jgi:hypothetical protein